MKLSIDIFEHAGCSHKRQIASNSWSMHRSITVETLAHSAIVHRLLFTVTWASWKLIFHDGFFGREADNHFNVYSTAHAAVWPPDRETPIPPPADGKLALTKISEIKIFPWGSHDTEVCYRLTRLGKRLYLPCSRSSDKSVSYGQSQKLKSDDEGAWTHQGLKELTWHLRHPAPLKVIGIDAGRQSLLERHSISSIMIFQRFYSCDHWFSSSFFQQKGLAKAKVPQMIS